MEAEGLLIPLVLVILWVFAYRYSSLVFSASGRNRFWMFLLTSVAIGVLTFLLIVVPEMNCERGLCILGPVIIWGGINIILQVLLPCVLIATALREQRRKSTKH